MPDVSTKTSAYPPKVLFFLKITGSIFLLCMLGGLCLTFLSPKLLANLPPSLFLIIQVGIPTSISCLSLLVLGVVGWKAMTKYIFADSSTPVSPIHSAAQGYAKLRGKGRPLPDEVVRPPLPRYCWPCLWYRITEEKRSYRLSDEWCISRVEQSNTPFMLTDATGECRINIKDALVLSNHEETFLLDPHTRIKLETLNYDDDIYVIGDFRTINCLASSLDADRDTRALLAEWGKNPQLMRQLLKLEGHGPFSERERALSQQAARFEVRRRHRKLRANPTIHTLNKPQTNRPFYISNIHQSPKQHAYARWIMNGFLGLLFLFVFPMIVGILVMMYHWLSL